MPKTIEEIIKKIDEKFSKELNRDDAEDFLRVVRTDLNELKEQSGENFKELVDNKVDELKKIIKKNLDEENTNWIRTQDDLGKVKKGLKDLQDSIAKKLSEKVDTSVLKKLTTVEVSKDVQNMTTKYVEAGVKATDIPILKEIGGLFGLATAAYHGTIEAGALFGEKAMDDAKELAQATGSGAVKLTEKGIDTVEHHADNVTKLTSQFMEGTDKNIAKIADSTTEVAKSLFGIFGGKGTLEEKVKMFEKLLEDKEKEIKELKEEIKEMRKSQNSLTAQVVQAAISRPSSPLPQ